MADTETEGRIPVIIAQLLAGYLLGDFFSGVFHWWEDRYCHPRWPIIGRLVCDANIEHQRFPRNTCTRTYWYRCGSSIIATAPFIALCLGFELYVLAVGLAVLSQANEIHSWSHQRMGRVIRFFQRIEFFCSPRHHAVHHVRPYDQRYCVISGWLNPILQAIRFWDLCERVTWIVFRARPNPERLVD